MCVCVYVEHIHMHIYHKCTYVYIINDYLIAPQRIRVQIRTRPVDTYVFMHLP